MPSKSTRGPSPASAAVVCALVAVVALIYWPVHRFGFVDFDDPSYVSDFPRVANGLTLPNIHWALTTNYLSNWHPLTWLSYMLDADLFGTRPGPIHVENVVLHTINSLLLFFLLRSMTAKPIRSAVVAMLFAVHPMHVESVAWISERKDVLSTAWLLASIWAYVKYTRAPACAGKWVWYLTTVTSFALSLAAKSMGVTLPLLLVLVDYWPLGRISFDRARPSVSWRILLAEKLPLMGMSLGCGILEIHAQLTNATLTKLQTVAWDLRLENAILGYVRYIAKLAIPTNLAAVYPYPRTIPLEPVVAALLLLILITLVVLRVKTSRPYLSVGWLWFVVALFPVVGIVQNGPQSIADRYSYLPSIGLFVAVVWLLADMAAKVPAGRYVVGVFALFVIGVFSYAGRIQVEYWRDTQTLFGHALAVTDDNWMAHYELGKVHAAAGEYDAAIREFAQTIQLNPGYANAYNELGNCIFLVNPPQSIQWFRQAVANAPGEFVMHYNLASALLQTGDPAGAVQEYREALKIEPDSANARKGLDIAMSKISNPPSSRAIK